MIILFLFIITSFAQQQINQNEIEFNNSTKTLIINKEGFITKIEIRKYCYYNSINETEIENIHLGKNVIFDKHSFDHLINLKTITIDEENELYKVKDNIIYSKDEKTLIYSLNNNQITNYIIPNNVEKIQRGAFSQGLFSSIEFPETLKIIGERSHYQNNQIQTIFIPENVQRIDEYAFVFNNELKHVIIVSKNITIENGVFYGCNNLKDVLILSDEIELKEDVFEKTKVSKIKVLENFDKQIKIDVDIDKVLKKGSCGNQCHWIYDINDKKLNIHSDDSLSSFEGFENANEVIEIILENEFKTIDCSEITFINNNQFIGIKVNDDYSENTFCDKSVSRNYGEIEGVKWMITDDSELIIYGNGTIPEYSRYEHPEWHEYKDKITSITIREGIKLIGLFSFYDLTKVTSFSVDSNNQYFTVKNDVLMTKHETEIIQYPIDKLEISYIIPDNTKIIREGSFEYSTLESLTITDTIETIESNAFSNCLQLNEVKYIYDKEPKNCGRDVFLNTPLLDKIKVPKNYEKETFCGKEVSKELLVGRCGENVRWIIENRTLNIYGNGEINNYSESPFGNYTNEISTIVIEEGITTIGNNIFNGITKVNEMYLPKSVIKIGDKSFDNMNTELEVIMMGKEEIICSNEVFKKLKTLKVRADIEQNMICGKEVTKLDQQTSGTGVYWLYDKIQKKLLIYGNGEMTNYGYDDKNLPWYSFKEEIENIEIEEGITRIGNYEFCLCSQINSILISNTVISIGSGTFENCTSLKELVIPSSVTTISDYISGFCLNLKRFVVEKGNMNYKSVDDVLYTIDGKTLVMYPSGKKDKTFIIQDNVETVWHLSFYGNDFLETVHIGKGLKTISKSPWAYCLNLKRFVVEKGNTNYKSVDGVLYTIDEKTLVIYPSGKKDKTFSIQDNVEKVLYASFYGNHFIETIHIGKGLKTVTYCPWIECSKLKYFSIDEQNEYFEIDDDVVFTKGKIHLFAYPNGKKDEVYYIPSTVTTIGHSSFRGCTKLETIFIPSSVTSIQGFSFDGAKSLKYILYEGSTTFSKCKNHALNRISSTIRVPTHYPTDATFCNFNVERTLTISKNSLGTNVHCMIDSTDNSLYVYGEGEMKDYQDEQSPLYKHRIDITKAVIGDYVTYIGNAPFASFSKLTTAIVLNSVEKFGNEIFWGCTSLENVYLGRNIKTFGLNPFYKCEKLKSITIDKNNPYIKFDNNILYTITEDHTLVSYLMSGEVTMYTIPNHIKTINSNAFGLSNNLISVTIPENVHVFGTHPFYRCGKLKNIIISDNHKYFKVEDGCLFTKDGKELIQYLMTNTQNSYTIPYGVERIYSHGISISSYLKNVLIPNTVKIIDSHSFKYNTVLEKVIISGSEQSISSSIFEGCPKLTSIIYDRLIEPSHWSSKMFYISSITTVKVSKKYTGSTTSFCGNSTVKVSKELEVGTLGKQINYILETDGTLSIYGNGTMNDYWHTSPVHKNTNIKTIEIHEGITHIGDIAFIEDTSLTSVSIPSTVTSIGYNPFTRCTSLTNINLNENTNFIFENDCLYDNEKTKLHFCLLINTRTSFTIPKNVKIIGCHSFSKSNIESIEIHDTIEEIDRFAFSLATNLKNVYIGKNVKTISTNVFHGCSSLTIITIHQENQYFKMIDGVLFDINSTRIISYLQTKDIEHYEIPNGIQILEWRSFSSNNHLKSVTIPSSVNQLYQYVFADCPNLQTITFKGTKEPSTYHQNALDGLPSTLVIKVPKNYSGTTFCGKKVTKSST